jgi:2-haloacid dehalogenase
MRMTCALQDPGRPIIRQVKPDGRWATFDCYGTLVDWMTGIRTTLSELWPEKDADELLADYHRIEPEVQAVRGISYRRVMAETLTRLAAAQGLRVPAGRDGALGDALPRGAGVN